MRKIVAALALLSVLVIGNKVLPQSPTASITGIVFDADNKVIPNAEIIVVNDLTRVQYETKTNGEGIYAAVGLPPGPYRVQVSKVDFKTIIKPDIILNVGDALSLNFTLPVGASSVSVTVEGGAPMINTTDASVSTVVDRQFAENLPMNGRSFQALIDLTPGVVLTPTSAQDNGQFSVNGQRAASNYWTIDGVSGNIGVGPTFAAGNGIGGAVGAFSALGGTNSLVSLDALQEFRIQTSTFAPEFGRTPGAQISIVTRSGTNRFHGSLFDYLRNDVLDANDWFADSARLPKPKERQNDFGGTLNGPIIKDRTFFFFSYEGLRLRLPQTSLTTVPDLAARQSAVAAMQPFLNAFPLPNGPEVLKNCSLTNPSCPATGQEPSGAAQFNASYSNPASLDAYSLRIDHKLGANLTIFGRYNYSPSWFDNRGGGSALSVVSDTRITTQTLTIGGSWAISSFLANDLRFNYSRVNANSTVVLDSFGGAVPLQALPFPDSFTTSNSLFYLGIYSLVGPSITAGKHAQDIQRQFNIVDGLSWQKGSHSFKVGADYRRLAPEYLPLSYGQSASFSDVASSELGISSTTVTANRGSTFVFNNLGLYAQDTWRVTPRLTLTYGLRWDVDFAPSASPSMASVTGFTGLDDLSDLALAPPGTSPFKTTFGNVAPRLGMAYQFSSNPDWQTVLRGGFGVFYDLVSSEAGNLVNSQFFTPPYGSQAQFSNVPFPLTPSQSAPVTIPATASLENFAVFEPDLKLPYTLEWNVALEQALGKQQAISLTYLGASGWRLLQSTILLSPQPTLPVANFQAGTFVGNTAESNYNALQVQFQRRLFKGLQGLASYTWSHSRDDASAGSFANVSNLGGGSSNENWGNSDFDIRNAFTAGVTYDIPDLRGNSFRNAMLHGWSVESLVLARSAAPVDLVDVNFYQLNNSVNINIRPDIVPGQPFYLFGAQYPGGKALNVNAFRDPPIDPVTLNPTRQGDLPRNFLRGFGATQWDFAVHRSFRVGESFKIEFRAELFNVLNHPNFGPPNTAFGTGGFGLATETLAESLTGSSASGAGGLNPLYQIGGPRSIQLALKFAF